MTPEDRARLDEIRKDWANGAARFISADMGFLLRLLDAATQRVAEQDALIGNLTTAYEESRAETVAAEAERDALRTALTSLRQEATAQQAAAEGARVADREWFASEARRYASHYPQSSDGWNTFLMLADRIRNGRPAATQPAAPKPIGVGGAKEAADDHAG